MSTRAFQKALIQLPLSREERATLTTDELFVLIAAGRLHGLTVEEQRRLDPGDLRELAAPFGTVLVPATLSRVAGVLVK